MILHNKYIKDISHTYITESRNSACRITGVSQISCKGITVSSSTPRDPAAHCLREAKHEKECVRTSTSVLKARPFAAKSVSSRVMEFRNAKEIKPRIY